MEREVAPTRRLTITTRDRLAPRANLSSSMPTSPHRPAGLESLAPHTRAEDRKGLEERYHFGTTLGNGAFGTVVEVRDRRSNQQYALKLVPKRKGDNAGVTQLQREVAIMRSVSHPYIIKLREVWETPSKVYMIMDLCGGGTLLDRVNKQGALSESDTSLVMLRLVDAVAYLHDNGIVHRDLKPENILLFSNSPGDDWNIRLSDFGLAAFLDTHQSMMESVCGTPIYMAPEVLASETYSHECDVWSMGVIMHLLLVAKVPFDAEAAEFLLEQIRSTKLDFGSATWSTFSEACKSLLSSMLEYDPAHRLSAKEVLDHPWVNGVDEEGRSSSTEINSKSTYKKRVTVLEMMKSYHAEMRFKRAIYAVLAANRWSRLGKMRAAEK